MPSSLLQRIRFAITRRGYVALLVPALVFLAGCGTPQPAVARHWHSTEIGLCEDYPEESRTVEAARRDLATAHAAGARVLRIAFGWDSMEPVRGRYDWAFWDEYVRIATDEYRLRLIPYVCYTPKWAATDQGENYWRSPPRDPVDFTRFMAVLVERYRDRIHSWELWNEPDNQAYWLGTTAQFGALVRAGSEAVRHADPSAAVVLGGISGELNFLGKLLRDEHVGPAVDVINVHSYYETWHPSPIEHLPTYIDSAAGLIRDNGGRQSLWLAETGYSSVGDRAEVSSVYRAHYRGEHTPEAQAAALVRTIVTGLTTNELAVIAWYRINDLVSGQAVIGDDNNRHFGVLDAGASPKPALGSLSLLTRLFGQRYETLAVAVSNRGAARGTPVVHAFTLEDNRRVVVAWLAMPEEPAASATPLDDHSASINVVVPGPHPWRVRVRDAIGQDISNRDSTWTSERAGTVLTLNLRGGEVRIVELDR